MTFKDKNLNTVLKELFPEGLGLRMRHFGKKLQYIELNFRSSEDREEALNKKIRADRTLDKDASVTRVGISNIPFEDDYPQQKWDRIKGYVKKLTCNYCSNRAS